MTVFPGTIPETLRQEFAAALGAAALHTGAAIHDRFRADIMGKYRGEPGLLVRPASTDEVATVLRLAHQHRVPVTVVGGQTGTVGGAIASAGSIALSLDRMTQIVEVDVASMTMTVEAGCVLQLAQEAAERERAFLPLDLGSRGSATIGGVIAANAGGNRVLRWGMMRDMVIGLEAVLADGTVVRSLTKMLKDNAGYNWKHLLIGSEGTLGIVTRAVLRLRPLPTTSQTALVATASFDDAVRLLRRLEVRLSGRLSSFELMWEDFYDVMTGEALVKRQRPMPTGYPYYALIEALGGDPEGDEAQFERALTAAVEDGLIADAVIARSERERNAIWAVREDMAPGLTPMKPFSVYDISMSLADMPNFVDHSRASVMAKFPAARLLFYGHAGDGNLHILINVDDGDDPHTDEVDALVFTEVQAVGGSIAAEHGVGVARVPYMLLTRSAEELALMRVLKTALDPRNILNPGKLLVDLATA